MLVRARDRAERRPFREGAALAVTGAGAFLASFDVSLANGLLPDIGASVGDANATDLAWVLTSYAIVFAAALVPAGRWADRVGRRRAYAIGLAVIGLGSLGCAVSPWLPVLIGCRAVQAFGAAIAAPASLGLLLHAVAPERRSAVTARWVGVGATGIAAGPVIGGVVTDLAGWRWAFGVNIVVVCAAAYGTVRGLTETTRTPGRGLADPWGAILMALAAALLTLGITQLGAWGLGLRVAAVLAAGTALGALFVRRCAAVADPVIAPDMVRNRTVLAATASTFFYSSAFFGLIYSYVQFLTQHWQLSLTLAGLAMLPIPCAVIAVSANAARLTGSSLRTPIVYGVILMGGALGLTSLFAHRSGFTWLWLLDVLAVGVGSGLSFPQLSAASVHGLSADRLAAASGLNQCARQIGAALGVAMSVAILAGHGPGQGYVPAWLTGAACCLLAAFCAAWIPNDSP